MPSDVALPHPSNDAARLAELRAQARPPRGPSASLTTALTAPGILPGREQEAWEIWRGLCVRSATGDAAAAEDMAMLTLLLANELNESHQLADLRTLTQAALKAAQLPRHRQEQLGRLCRLAVREGDNAAALEALGAMTVDPPDLESDSELRVSAAAVATLVGDSQLVLSLVGQSAQAVPIDASLGPLSIALRANALEQLGQLGEATRALRELPHFAMLADLERSFAVLKLCPRSRITEEDLGPSVHRNLAAPLGTGLTLGILFLGCALFLIGARMLSDTRHVSAGDTAIHYLGIGFLLLLGVPLLFGGVKSRDRVTFLRQHGILRRGRVIQISGTTARLGSIPIYQLTLELVGPQGAYRVMVSKALYAPEASAIVGNFLNVLADPGDRTDVILDEATLL